jgi:hypothetical protein
LSTTPLGLVTLIASDRFGPKPETDRVKTVLGGPLDGEKLALGALEA